MGKDILRVGKMGDEKERELKLVGNRYWLVCGQTILASVNRPDGGMRISLR